MAARTENAKVARRLVPVPLVGQVMDMKVVRLAAVLTAAAGTGERFSPPCLPLRASFWKISVIIHP